MSTAFTVPDRSSFRSGSFRVRPASALRLTIGAFLLGFAVHLFLPGVWSTLALVAPLLLVAPLALSHLTGGSRRVQRSRARLLAEQMAAEAGAYGRLPAWVLVEDSFSGTALRYAASGLTPAQLEVLEALASEFEGTVDDLVSAARSLA